jgi:hypothetical protein
VTESGRVEARHTEVERSAWDYTVGFFLRPQLLTHFEFEKLIFAIPHALRHNRSARHPVMHPHSLSQSS